MTRGHVWATAAAGAALVAMLGLGGWAAASAPHPAAATASDGRVLQVRYELKREAPYVAPPATEATRLDVLDARSPIVVEDGVLSAQAGEALRSLQAEDAARTAQAMATVRAEDARIDRETTSALDAGVRGGAPAPETDERT